MRLSISLVEHAAIAGVAGCFALPSLADHPFRVDSSIDLPPKKNQKSEFKKTSGIPSPPPPPPQELLDTKLKGGKRLQMCFAPGSRYQSNLRP